MRRQLWVEFLHDFYIKRTQSDPREAHHTSRLPLVISESVSDHGDGTHTPGSVLTHEVWPPEPPTPSVSAVVSLGF